MNMHPHQRRAGLTLLEVIVSMAIFLISVTALYQLVLMGGERAMEIRLQSRTSMRCQAKLAELMIGAESLDSSGSYTPFEDESDKDLQWKVEATQSSEAKGLWTVKVFVKAELPTGVIVESQLNQMMLDPTIRGTTFDEPNTAPAGTATKDAATDPNATPPTTTTPDPMTTPNTQKGPTTPNTQKGPTNPGTQKGPPPNTQKGPTQKNNTPKTNPKTP